MKIRGPTDKGKIEPVNSRLDEEEVRQILSDSQAVIINSHVVYTSGRHGSDYFDENVVYPNTQDTARLCEGMAERSAKLGVEVVIGGPEQGGVILSQWTAYYLDSPEHPVKAVYAEKCSGIFTLKDGWHELVHGKNVLVVEDVLNTGGSVKKVINLVRKVGGNIVGVAVICNRGGITCTDLDAPQLSQLLNVTFDSWKKENCHLCDVGVPINTSVGHGKQFLARRKKK